MGTHPIFESDFDCLTLLDSNRMFRLCNSLRPLIGSRGISFTRPAGGFFDNLKESLKEEAKKEKLDEDLDQMAKYKEKMKKEQLEKFGDSEKFKKLKKQTATFEEKLSEQMGDVGEKIKTKVGVDLQKETEKIMENVKNFEFTQKPTDRMDV